MGRLVRLRCPECSTVLRLPQVEDRTLVTCPRCGAEFTQDAVAAAPTAKAPNSRKKKPTEHQEEEPRPKSPKRSRAKRSTAEVPHSSKQPLVIGSIIAVAVLAAVAAIVVPVMSKSGDRGNAQAQSGKDVQPAPPPESPGPAKRETPAASVSAPMPPEDLEAAPGLPPAATGTPSGTTPLRRRVRISGAGSAGQPTSGAAQAPSKPTLDLDQGKSLIMGSWEIVVVNPRTKKSLEITHQFDKDGKYSLTQATGGKSQQMAGNYEMTVKEDAYLVTVAASPLKDGKAVSNKTLTLTLVQFNGKDTMLLASPDGQKQALARKK